MKESMKESKLERKNPQYPLWYGSKGVISSCEQNANEKKKCAAFKRQMCYITNLELASLFSLLSLSLSFYHSVLQPVAAFSRNQPITKLSP